jgi:predicted Rossmann fold nucleotide-binding protein DprA/Smf involved in DNA uptake
MKWILFTGTWRLTDSTVEHDVREAVREVLAAGNGVLTGGATGVDFFAMDELLKHDPDAKLLRVIIPADLDSYILDYKKNWQQEPITAGDIDALEAVLKRIKMANHEALTEMPYKEITQDHYDQRNEWEVAEADEVYAFQMNGSSGTQHTVDYAVKQGKPIGRHVRYVIAER